MVVPAISGPRAASSSSATWLSLCATIASRSALRAAFSACTPFGGGTQMQSIFVFRSTHARPLLPQFDEVSTVHLLTACGRGGEERPGTGLPQSKRS